MGKIEYISPSVETIELLQGSHICNQSLENEDIETGDIIEWEY